VNKTRVYISTLCVIMATSCETGPRRRVVDGRVIPSYPRWRYMPTTADIGVQNFKETRVYVSVDDSSDSRLYYHIFFPTGQTVGFGEYGDKTRPRVRFEYLRNGTVGYYQLDPSRNRLYLEWFGYDAGRWAWRYWRREYEYSDQYIRSVSEGWRAVRIQDAEVLAKPDW